MISTCREFLLWRHKYIDINRSRWERGLIPMHIKKYIWLVLEFIPSTQIKQIEKVIFNEEFPYDNQWIKYDIALLKLKTPLELNDDVQPACLPTEEMNSIAYSHDECYISGWGASSKWNRLQNAKYLYTVNVNKNFAFYCQCLYYSIYHE